MTLHAASLFYAPLLSFGVMLAGSNSAALGCPPLIASSPAYTFRQNFIAQLRTVRHSRAAWCFAAVWIASALCLLVAGYSDEVLFRFVYLLALLLFTAITASITEAQPRERQTSSRIRLWLQMAVMGVFIL